MILHVGWHDSFSSANTKTRTIEDDNVGIKRKRQLEDANLLKKRKTENSKAGTDLHFVFSSE